MTSVNNQRQHVRGEEGASAIKEQNDTNLEVLLARVHGEHGT